MNGAYISDRHSKGDPKAHVDQNDQMPFIYIVFFHDEGMSSQNVLS
jgi:hypothetical protein